LAVLHQRATARKFSHQARERLKKHAAGHHC
jgi:hypothetical protein